ncbi:MAG: non-homologous end-joining DNA ligase, partial [Hydrogenophaga sp.]
MNLRTSANRSEPHGSVRAVDPDPLQAYRGKRNFSITSEPEGQRDTGTGGSFVVQKHWASRLHYDFRLEVDGVMKSWAVPKGPSLDPTVKRMAVEVEDHPVSYASFEGTIPAGQYGAGRVIVWDQGQWQPVGDPGEGLEKGHLKLDLVGHKLRGRWALVRLKKQDTSKQAWLLIKERDRFARGEAEFNVVEAEPHSVNAAAPPSASSAPSSKTDPWPEGALRSALPKQLAPQLATQSDQPPAEGENWMYEIKFDGYRMLARIDGTQVQLFTRNGHDWTHRLAPLQRSLADLHLPDGWYDGEIVVPGTDGMPDFGALQKSFDNGRTCEVVFHVFDLPHVDGHDLTNVPLVQRREVLKRVLATSPSDRVRLSETFAGAGVEVLEAACKLGLEGVMAKRNESLYRSARSTDWLKLKCGQRQEFVIGGYTEGKGSRASLGALLLGVHDDHGLRHVGNVGTGFSQASLAALLKRLGLLQRASSPFSPAPKPPGVVHWTDPELVAEVGFSGWTREGRIRHSRFLGLRDDKPAASVQREHPVPAKAATSMRELSGKTVPAQTSISA